MVQRVKNLTAVALVLITGPVQWVKGSGVAAVQVEAVVQVVAMAQIQSLARELPCAMAVRVRVHVCVCVCVFIQLFKIFTDLFCSHMKLSVRINIR